MIIKAILLASALFASTCQTGPFKPAPVDPVPFPPEQYDAAPAPSNCSVACAHLAALGCPEAQPTPKGATCVDVCSNVDSSGTVSMQTDCVVRAVSCADANACQAIQ
jgi:hypothetical protein